MVTTTARTGTRLEGTEPVAVGAASLRASTMAGLDNLFADLDATEVHELGGVLKGEVVATFVDALLGKAIGRAVVAMASSHLSPWTGKQFEGRSGANMWLTASGRITLGSFRVRESVGLDGLGEVLLLDYDVPENVPPLRRVVGEVKRVGPGLHLGRMSVRWASGPSAVLYFVLEA